MLTIDKMPGSNQILAKSAAAALKRHQHCSLFPSPIPTHELMFQLDHCSQKFYMHFSQESGNQKLC